MARNRLLRSLRLQSLERLLPEFRPYRGRLGVIVALGLFIAAVQPLCVRLTQLVIDNLRVGGDMALLRRLPLMLVGLFAVLGAARYLYNTVRRYLLEKIVLELRNRLFRRYLTMPLRRLDGLRTGELLASLQNDLQAIYVGIDTLCDVLREPFTFLGLLGMAFYCDWRLTLMTLASAPLVILLFDRSGAAVKRYSERNLRQFADLMALGQESLAGSRIVKVFRLEGRLDARFRDIQERYFHTVWKSIRVQEISTPAVEFIGAVVIAAVIYYGSYRAAQGLLTSGQLIAFILALGLCQMPIKKLNNAYLRVRAAEAAVDRVYAVLDEDAGEPALDSGRTPAFTREIRFEDVSLAYGEKHALDGVSFEVKKGEVVALVGPSGSGKSSIVNLLPRLYDVSGGRILLDGRDVRELGLADLRGLFSFVTQDVFLFNDTIYENIRYGRPDATREEIIEAARRSHCLEFVERAPRGLETMIGDRGVCLSGGERQRLAIARALVSRAPLLVLDEATSSLDSRSEKLVQEALDELMEGRTTFLVAHRFSTIRRADRIFVLEKGTIRERGTHEELLGRGGLYHGLYRQQYFAPEREPTL